MDPKVAREFGRLIRRTAVTKQATRRFAQILTKVAMLAGLPDVKSLVKAAQGWGYGMPQMGGYGMDPSMMYGGGGMGGYGMNPYAAGNPYMMGAQAMPEMDPEQYESRGVLQRAGDWLFGSSESPMARRAREVARANKHIGFDPKRMGQMMGGQGGGGGMYGGGGGHMGLRGPEEQRMWARMGVNPGHYQEREGAIQDFMGGLDLRGRQAQAWKQLASRPVY